LDLLHVLINIGAFIVPMRNTKPAEKSASFIIDSTPDDQAFFLFDWAFSLLSQRCDEQLPEDASHGCGMSSLAKHFFEWTERRASEATSREDRRGLYYMIGRKI